MVLLSIRGAGSTPQNIHDFAIFTSASHYPQGPKTIEDVVSEINILLTEVRKERKRLA